MRSLLRGILSRAGVRLLVYLADVLVGDLRVHLRRGDVCMPEQFLHVPQRRAAPQHMSGK